MKIVLDVLLVEDNEDDLLLTQLALENLSDKFTINLITAENGEEALKFLKSGGKCDLILSDINMPRLNGFELLKLVKEANSPWRQIPFCMLTTSPHEADIFKAYYNYATCYLCKPVGYKSFLSLIQQFFTFWLEVSELPK